MTMRHLWEEGRDTMAHCVCSFAKPSLMHCHGDHWAQDNRGDGEEEEEEEKEGREYRASRPRERRKRRGGGRDHGRDDHPPPDLSVSLVIRILKAQKTGVIFDPTNQVWSGLLNPTGLRLTSNSAESGRTKLVWSGSIEKTLISMGSFSAREIPFSSSGFTPPAISGFNSSRDIRNRFPFYSTFLLSSPFSATAVVRRVLDCFLLRSGGCRGGAEEEPTPSLFSL